MRKFIQQKLKDQKGLTLIELLAVIVILAIIAAIAIPAIGNIIENSRVGAAKSDALNILNAAEIYATETSDAFTDTASTITQAELTAGGFIDDIGGFANGSITSVTLNATGDMELNATAVVGEVTVVFLGATKADISGVPNSSATGANGITITRP